ncbi:CAN8 protein, partial [Acrocephalus arundinaceus]|nr:CAN8 protein [Acrocephalus arundinaceus]
TYWTNPQFKIWLDEPDDDHAGSSNEPCCTILVGLMQKNRRRQKRMGEGLLSIGYSLYQVKFLENSTDVHAGHAFFAMHQPAAQTDPYVNLHEVSRRMMLPLGQYLIVPSTFEPYKNGEFCLRVFLRNRPNHSDDHRSMADGSSESSSSDGSSDVSTKHSAGNKIPQLCEG